MSTKKSMLFLFAVILISIAFITTLFIGDTSPITLDGSNNSDNQDPATTELGLDDMKKELKVAVSMDTPEYLKLVELSLQYEGFHNDIKIDVVSVDKEEAYDYYKKASQMGDAPDIMLLDNAWINEFAALSYLAEVDEILTSNIQDLQIAPMISQVKWNGFLWAVPKEIDPYILAWNKNSLQEQGFSGLPSTLEEFMLLNQTLINSEDERLGFYFDVKDPFAFISLLWTLGETWTDSQENKLNLNNEETIQKLEAFFLPKYNAVENKNEDTENFRENKLSIHYPMSDEEFVPRELLKDGTLSMMLMRLSDFRRNDLEGIEITALPFLDDALDSEESKGGWLHGKSFAVSSRSALKKEAFDWIQSVTTTDAQMDLMKAGGGLPVMLSAYAERLNSVPFYQEIVTSIEQGQVFSAHPELPDKLEILQAELYRLWLNELTIPQFLEQMDQSWNELMGL